MKPWLETIADLWPLLLVFCAALLVVAGLCYYIGRVDGEAHERSRGSRLRSSLERMRTRL